MICLEDEEELVGQRVVARGEAEDARFEGFGVAPDDDVLLWVGPSS